MKKQEVKNASPLHQVLSKRLTKREIRRRAQNECHSADEFKEQKHLDDIEIRSNVSESVSLRLKFVSVEPIEFQRTQIRHR